MHWQNGVLVRPWVKLLTTSEDIVSGSDIASLSLQTQGLYSLIAASCVAANATSVEDIVGVDEQ